MLLGMCPQYLDTPVHSRYITSHQFIFWRLNELFDRGVIELQALDHGFGMLRHSVGKAYAVMVVCCAPDVDCFHLQAKRWELFPRRSYTASPVLLL
jgi:hypothetical protein